MRHDPLDQFVCQLACWAEELLQKSRSPLRRIDLAPEIWTACGPLQPDLVLWVNRDSCMAGGVVLVPSRETGDAAEKGRHCALALGLRHFVIWGADEITVWEIEAESLSPHKRFPAPPAGSDAARFRQILAAVLEELKYLTVAGAIAPGDLSPHYLVNLCLLALTDTESALTEMMRVARSERRPGTEGSSPEYQGLGKALLTLARLTALLHLDQLPPTVQPEGLERAMVFALDSLPPNLRGPLLPAADELPLPLETAVRFHHLLRRLTQLGGCRDRGRLATLLDQLRACHQQELGLSTLPDLPMSSGGRLLVQVGGLSPCPGDIEVAPPAALALSALLRHLRGQPEATVQVPDPFRLPGNSAPRMVVAALENPAPVAARERAALQAKLRISWPTRRFNLPSGLPRWSWEMLHLLGLAAADARLLLRTPDNWLAAPFAPALLEVLQTECSIRELRRTDPDRLDLLLVKDGGRDHRLLLIRPEGSRPLDGAFLQGAPASLWALAVELAEPLWALFEDRLLQPAGAEDWPADQEPAVMLFAHSSLGRALWQVVGMGQPLPARKRLSATLKACSFPLPRREVLAHLQRLAAEEPSRVPSQASIDGELAPWFDIPSSPRSATVSSPTTAGREAEALDYPQLREMLEREVLHDGAPVFPEHYLFAHYRPQLQEYRFTPPLRREEQFFGEVTLRDQAGQALHLATPELAEALELIAAAGRQLVSLPTDSAILEDILNRYLHDLRTLHGTLQKRVHALVADPRQARRTIRRFWDGLDLPGPELLHSREK